MDNNSDQQEVRTQERPKVISAGEIQRRQRENPSPPPAWIVNGLLRAARRRPSLILGKPGTGKSSLAWQMAVAVCKGIPFLERDTKKSSVLYWQTEESEDYDLAEIFNRLGYDETTDKPLLTQSSLYFADPMRALHDMLDDNPQVELVIVEPLNVLLRLPDFNDNGATDAAFRRLDQIIMGPFSRRIAMVGLHHIRKRDQIQDESDGILGASTIAARTDAWWFLKKVGTQRQFWTEQRKGEEIERHNLVFDSVTKTSRLGATVKEEKHSEDEIRDQHLLNQMIAFYQKNPGAHFEELCRPYITGGNSKQKRAVFYKWRDAGMFAPTSKGVRGKKQGYRYVGIPVEKTRTPQEVTTPVPISAVEYDLNEQLGKEAA